MTDKECPNCGMGIIYNPEIIETGMMECLCGFPLLLPIDEYGVVELDENKEKIIACLSSLGEVEN